MRVRKCLSERLKNLTLKGAEYMSRPIAIGSQSFSTIIEENCFFVDKTLFIKDWWENRHKDDKNEKRN